MSDTPSCPTCGTDTLEWSGGDAVEYENYWCSKCDGLFRVDIEISRKWDTIEESDDD